MTVSSCRQKPLCYHRDGGAIPAPGGSRAERLSHVSRRKMECQIQKIWPPCGPQRSCTFDGTTRHDFPRLPGEMDCLIQNMLS
jgi:hypothetical protein